MMPDEPAGAAAPAILTREDGATIAYHRTRGKAPAVVFMGGFMSDMTGAKALALEAHCRRQGRGFVRFDYFGHGASSGDFAAGTIGRWRDDALAVIDGLTAGPLVLVGSSMGGWIMLLAALARPDRAAGLIAIAPAPDFTEALMWAQLSEAHRRTIVDDGQIRLPSAYDPMGYVVTRQLIEEGRGHLLLGGPIPITCPVRILHGMDDADVPWRHSLRLVERLAAADVTVTLIKDGDHRLSNPHDLERLTVVLDQLLDELARARSPER